MSKEAEKLASLLERPGYGWSTTPEQCAALLRRQAEQIRELREALALTGVFLHHCWCDVPMNESSFQRLSDQMELVDKALSNTKESE